MPTPPPETVYDLAIVGAGPAGMSAAVTAADSGARVCVLDINTRPGGQYWRWGPRTDDGRFHHGWRTFGVLRERFRAGQASGRITHLPGHAVFAVERPAVWRVHAVDERTRSAATVSALAVLVATGAYDLQLPIPGWTLPGVMAAGGAQALLKGSSVPAGKRAVVAGTGPLLLPVAASLVAAGVEVQAVAEANDPIRYLARPAAVGDVLRKLPEALGYAALLARHRVPVLRHHAIVAAHGAGALTHVTIARLDRDWNVVAGSKRSMQADLLATGYGLVPQVDLLTEAGSRMQSDQAGFPVALVGPDQQTTVPGLYAAGETTGVAGAEAAVIEGRLAGEAATGHRRIEAASDRRRLLALRRFADLLQDVHAIGPAWTTWLGDDTILCRCEEVTVRQIREAQVLGADDTRSVKLLARPGMGWCQGRMCGHAVSALIGDGAGSAARRPLAAPVPLAVLTQMAAPSSSPRVHDG